MNILCCIGSIALHWKINDINHWYSCTFHWCETPIQSSCSKFLFITKNIPQVLLNDNNNNGLSKSHTYKFTTALVVVVGHFRHEMSWTILLYTIVTFATTVHLAILTHNKEEFTQFVTLLHCQRHRIVIIHGFLYHQAIRRSLFGWLWRLYRSCFTLRHGSCLLQRQRMAGCPRDPWETMSSNAAGICMALT